jgi:hypothetical protein
VLAVVVAIVALLIPTTIVATGAAASATTTLSALDTAWTTAREPNTAQRQTYLSATSAQDRTFLKFSGTSLNGKIIKSAKLVLTVNATTATKSGVVVAKTSADWRSPTLTHSVRPSDGRMVSKAAPAAVARRTVEVPLDVSSISTTGTFSFSVGYSQKYIQLKFYRFGAKAPKLVVEYQDAPRPTATPSPSTTPTTAPVPAPSTTPRPSATPTPTPTPTPTQAPAPAPSEPSVPANPTSPNLEGPLVFAHYFVPYPLSLDNQPTNNDYYARNYLKPEGENNKWANAGGLLRDRPVPPGVSSQPDWQIRNFMTEIRQAQAAGIDGWTLNLLSASGQNWDSVVNMMKAADRVGGFLIVPMVDGTASFSTQSPSTVARLLADLYKYKSVYVNDGQFVLSSFKAEGRDLAWWTEVIRLLEAQYKLPISFQAVFLNAGDANMKAFAGIADSFGNWGMRTEANILRTPNNDARAAAYGKTWMEPIAVQDVRARSYTYADSYNTAAVRAQWAKAIREDVDFIQLVTWNDYSESTQINPSVAHGTSFLDLTSYYSKWYHSGIQPKITDDAMIVTHRIQFTNATPTFRHQLMAPNLGGESFTPRDTVEALVWLTSPATVEITAGGKTSTFQAPAGVSAFTAPLELGTISAKIIRNGTAVDSVVSPHEVISKPFTQDLQYYAVSTW